MRHRILHGRERSLHLLIIGHLLWAAAASLMLSCTSSRPHPTVADARVTAPGGIVTASGIVTVRPGAFRSATGDEGFAIQSGDAGIWISPRSAMPLEPGDEVTVEGRVTDRQGMAVLEATSTRRIGRREVPSPLAVRTRAVGESTEGLLVAVQGRVTRPVGDDLPYGHRVFIDDGSGELQLFIPASTGIDVQAITEGTVVHAVGLSGQYADHYEVNPRGPGDLSTIAAR